MSKEKNSFHDNQNGNGSIVALLACGGIIVVWLIFNTFMGFIGDRHQAKVEKNMNYLNSFNKQKPVDNSPKEVRGYQVSY